MKHIVIVAGPTCTGKSTYIKNHFPDYKVVDLFDFQKGIILTADNVLKSYENCRDALIKAIKENDKVILEHTLLMAKRRPMYIDAIRSVTNDGIDMYFILPDVETYKERLKQRGENSDDEFVEMMMSIAETPDKSEGYKNVFVIKE